MGINDKNFTTTRSENTMDDLFWWVMGLVGLICSMVHLGYMTENHKAVNREKLFRGLTKRIETLECQLAAQEEIDEEANMEVQKIFATCVDIARKDPRFRKRIHVLHEKMGQLPELDSQEKEEKIQIEWWIFAIFGFLGLVIILTLFFCIRERCIGHNFVPDLDHV